MLACVRATWLLTLMVGVEISACIVEPDDAARVERSNSDTVDAPPRSSDLPEPGDSELNSNGTPKTLPPGPPDLPGQTLQLDYWDFGPSAASGGLLGMPCWQWARCCCSELGDRYDVRVVVYRNLDLAQVEQRYPTVPGRSDFRLVSYDDALRYLDEHIEYLESDDVDIPTMLATLRATRARLVAELGGPT